MRSSFFRLPKNRKFDYQPRYYDPEEEERKARRGESNIKLEKGSFYKQKSRSNLVGAFSERDIIYRSRESSRKNQLVRIIMLTVMMGVITLYFVGKIGGVMTIGIMVFLLIAFVSRVNRF